MDTLAIYENELITSPFRKRTYLILRYVFCFLWNGKFSPYSLILVLSKKRLSFPWRSYLILTPLYLDSSSQRCKTLPISTTGHLCNAHTRFCPFCVRFKSICDYIEIPEVAMLRVSLPKTPGPAEV